MCMEMFNSLLLSCIVKAEVGLGRLLYSKTSSFGAAAGLITIQLLSGPARWEISKSFTKGIPSLPPFRDKETKRRRDLPKVLLQREQKPGHSTSRGPVEPPQFSGCTALLRHILLGSITLTVSALPGCRASPMD